MNRTGGVLGRTVSWLSWAARKRSKHSLVHANWKALGISNIQGYFEAECLDFLLKQPTNMALPFLNMTTNPLSS